MTKKLARTKAHGLVVAPPRLDCMGESCTALTASNGCFINEHHLYFPADLYGSTALKGAFRANRLNRVWMPRCRHDKYHDQIDGTLVPDEDVMAAFLDEAKILQQLDVVTKNITLTKRQLQAARNTRLGVRVAYSPHGRSHFEEHLLAQSDLQAQLARLALGAEIIPIRQLTGSHVVGLAACHQLLTPETAAA